jgi:ACS family D-galactonate transporter-like MFS transporter
VTGPWRLVALLMLVVAFGHFNRISMSVAGADRIISEDHGIKATQMGMVYSAFLLCYTLAMLPGGWAIDRFGPRAALSVLCAGSAVFVALTGLTGFVGQTPALLLGCLLVVRAVMGIVNTPLHPGSAAMIGQLVPVSQVSLANGLVTFAACVGTAATYVVFGALMDLLGWPGAFYVSSGLTFLVFLAWTCLAPTPARHQASTPRSFSADVFRHRGLICLTLSYAAMGYFQYQFFYWVESYFKDILRLTDERSRFYSSLVTLANGVGMVIGGWLTDRASPWLGRRGRTVIPMTGLIGSAVVLVPGLMTTQAELTLFCFIAAMAMLGLCEAPSWTTAVEVGGQRGGTTAALMNTGGNAGGLLAPVITPGLSEYLGWQMGMGLAGLVAVLGALLWLGVDPDARLGPAPDGEKRCERSPSW